MVTLNAQTSWRPKFRGKYVGYLRTSTKPYSRLNVVKQRAAIRELLSGRPARVIRWVEEQEPLTDGERPALEEAIAECKARNANLIFGQLDRMRRNVYWLEIIYSHGIRVAAADIPHFAHDEYMKLNNQRRLWRLRMGELVSEALANAKSRGETPRNRRGVQGNLKLGPAASAKARRQKAIRRGAHTMSEIDILQCRGITSLTGIAEELNRIGHAAPRGGLWSAAQVSRVIKRHRDRD